MNLILKLTCILLLLPFTVYAQSTDVNVLSLEALHGLELCGNAVLNTGAVEQCDDGNIINGDGCSSTCQIEIVVPTPTGLLVDSAWAQIPGSEMDSVFVPGVDDRLPKGISGWRNIQLAWNGGTCVGNDLWIFGGGHNDSDRNNLLKVDPQTGVWTRVTEPSPIWLSSECPGGTCASSVGPCPFDNCPVNPDGTPVSRHTYYAFVSDGVNLYSQTYAIWRLAPLTPIPRFWKFTTTGTWSSLPESPLYPAGFGSLLHVDGKIYHTSGYGKASFDIATNTWTATNQTGRNAYTGLVYAPTSDRIFFLGGGVAEYATPSTWGQAAITIPNRPSALTAVSPGIAYYGPEDLILIWNGGPTITTLNPTTLEWGAVTPTGAGPGAGFSQGTFGRFAYCGGRVVLVNGVSVPMWYVDIPAPILPPPEPVPSSCSNPDVVLSDTADPMAFRAAMMAVPPNGGKLLIQSGVYTVPPAGVPYLSGRKAMTICGEGAVEIRGDPASRPNVLINWSATNVDLTIENVSFSGSGGDCLSAGSGDYTENAQHITLKRVKAFDCGHHALIVGWEVNKSLVTFAPSFNDEVVIEDSEFSNSGTHNVYIDRVKSLKFYRSKSFMPGNGHALKVVAYQFDIQDSEFSNSSLAGDVDTFGASSLDIVSGSTGVVRGNRIVWRFTPSYSGPSAVTRSNRKAIFGHDDPIYDNPASDFWRDAWWENVKPTEFPNFYTLAAHWSENRFEGHNIPATFQPIGVAAFGSYPHDGTKALPIPIGWKERARDYMARSNTFSGGNWIAGKNRDWPYLVGLDDTPRVVIEAAALTGDGL